MERKRSLFESRKVKNAREIAEMDEARKKEGQAVVAYLKGEIPIEEYRKRLEETYPITHLDFRKLATELDRESLTIDSNLRLKP
jgi:hypothetical protein